MDDLVWPHVPYAPPTHPERERWIEQVAREDDAWWAAKMRAEEAEELDEFRRRMAAEPDEEKTP